MPPLNLLIGILPTISYKRPKDCTPHQTHIAIIYKRGKVLSVGINKLGTRSRGCGWNTVSIHAEIDAIKDLGDISKLRGASLIVVRINRLDEIVYSKPCASCQCVLEKCMKIHGLRNVYHS
jgi:hypothetical protein